MEYHQSQNLKCESIDVLFIQVLEFFWLHGSLVLNNSCMILTAISSSYMTLRKDFITIALQQREKYFLCIRNLNYTKFNAFHRVFKQIDLFPSVHAMTAHGDKTISFLLKLGWVPYLLHAQEQSILTFSRCEIWRCSCRMRYCPITYRNVETWCNLQCTEDWIKRGKI